jgi:hypothetical protein
MTQKKFLEIINKADEDCNYLEMQMKNLWKENNFKRLFEITGLDLSNFSKSANENEKKILHG